MGTIHIIFFTLSNLIAWRSVLWCVDTYWSSMYWGGNTWGWLIITTRRESIIHAPIALIVGLERFKGTSPAPRSVYSVAGGTIMHPQYDYSHPPKWIRIRGIWHPIQIQLVSMQSYLYLLTVPRSGLS